MSREFLTGLKHGVPIGLGYLSVSFAFGIAAVGAGLTPLQALLISMTNVTSAGQLAGLQLMAADVGAAAVTAANLFQMALTQLTINLRYALMSISLSQKMDRRMNTLRRMIFAFCNTDEIFAVASGRPGKLGPSYLYGLMAAPYAGWSAGTFLGAVAGNLMPLFVQRALGIAIYGMFIAIILPPSREKKPVRLVVLIAAALSMAFRWIPGLSAVPAGYVIILCAVTAACIGAALFPSEEEEQA